MAKIAIGTWRDDPSGPMQIVSGAYGRAGIHYEVPAALRIRHELRTFLAWSMRTKL